MSTDSARLILFDIDQTLIFTAGAGMRCMLRAVREVTGLDASALKVHLGGKTDPLILDELLTFVDHPGNGVVDEIWRVYAEYLGGELEIADERRVMKPGVPQILEALTQDARAHLGLLTGNLEITARIKLAAFDLNRWFEVGAFGSDSADRDALGAVALARAERHFQRKFAPSQIWVVGDTERDIACARACGARVLAVATGHMSVEELQAHHPDAVLADLSDLDAVERILLA